MRIKAFSVIKNEEDIIEDWIYHYLYLCGDNNVHIIVNDTTDRTISILEKFKGKVTVDVKFGEKVQKGYNGRMIESYHNHIHSVIDRYRTECDVILPVDADEFLVKMVKDDQISCSKQEIIETIETYFNSKYDKYRVGWTEAVLTREIYDDPLLEVQDFIYASAEKMQKDSKMFFRAQDLVSVFPGQHDGESRREECLFTNLSLVHFRFRGASHFVNKVNKFPKRFAYYQRQNFQKYMNNHQIHLSDRTLILEKFQDLKFREHLIAARKYK